MSLKRYCQAIVDGTMPERKMLNGYLDGDLLETIARNQRHELLLAQQVQIEERSDFLERLEADLAILVEDRNRLLDTFNLEIARQTKRIQKERQDIDVYHTKLNEARDQLLVTRYNATLALVNTEVAELTKSGVLGE
jgi:hypothetical protein